MRRYTPIVLALLPVLFTTESARADRIPAELQTLLDEADHLELLSIDPDRSEKQPPEHFHGWKLLGKTTVQEAKVRKQLVAAFKKGVEENTGIISQCFEPRHGLRVKRGDLTVDFVICLSCHRVLVYRGDKQEKGLLIMDSPRAEFNRVLQDAKVRLPRQPGEMKTRCPE